jgi:choline-glycine betaine transporter
MQGYTGCFTMLFATGMGIGLMFYGVSELKAAALTTGAPFALVLLGMCVAIWKDLSSERASLQNA